MSDAKARHFKPHGRFPFVTSIWWRLNNSAREQAQGAQPPHTTAWRRRTTGRAPVDVYHHLHHHRNTTTTTTTRKLLPRFVILSIRWPNSCQRGSLSLSRISHLWRSSNPPSHPPFHDVPHEVRDKISSELRNRTCQTTPIPASNVQATPFSPSYPLPLRRPLQCHATSTIPPLRPAVADNRPPLSLSFSFILSANDKLTLERGALSMPMRAIFKRGDFFERKIDLHIYIYMSDRRGKRNGRKISKLFKIPSPMLVYRGIALEHMDGKRCKDGWQ